jgi:3D (Asp-Asp-Asp) domain-containing protein
VIRPLIPLLLTLAVSAQEGWVLAEVTAYCPCALCCDVRTERTADGTDTNERPYGVAGSPNIPLGSIVFVPYGVGYLDGTRPTARAFILDDRGGALRTEWRRTGITRLDLRYRTHASAKQFGRKLMMVYIKERK